MGLLHFIICNTLSEAYVYEVVYKDTEWKQVLYTDVAPVPIMPSTTLVCLHQGDCIQYKLQAFLLFIKKSPAPR